MNGFVIVGSEAVRVFVENDSFRQQFVPVVRVVDRVRKVKSQAVLGVALKHACMRG